MTKETIPAPVGYLLIILTPEDEPKVQALLERCADYIELVSDLPPSPTMAHDLYRTLPEGKSYEDKFLIGLFTPDNELIGVLDAIRDHPQSDEWYIGLLLLEPEQRGHSLGEQTYHAFERWAAQRDAQAVRLTVAEQNERAYRFWQRLGFVEIERQPLQMFGAKESVFIMMRREIADIEEAASPGKET
jgi:ribosomal protein S18 acetylase RimI-like enzyme